MSNKPSGKNELVCPECLENHCQHCKCKQCKTNKPSEGKKKIKPDGLIQEIML